MVFSLLTAALATPSATPGATATTPTQNILESHRPRNRRRGRGSGVGSSPGSRPNPNPPSQERAVVGGRSFGGQLTRLHPDAPTFVPASVPPPPSGQSPLRPPRHRPPSQKPAGSHPETPVHTGSVLKKGNGPQ